MKATKKIVGASCALVAAVALSAGSTFAWFSTNDTVTATGMSVQTTVQKNLVISSNSTVGNEEASTANSAITGTVTLSPASVATLAGSQNFFKVTNNVGVDYNSGKVSEGTVFGEAAVSTTSETIADVIKHTFYIRSTSESYSNLYVSAITVGRNSATSAVSPALRVGVVCGNNGFIYAPVEDAATTYYAINKADTVESVAEGGEITGNGGVMSAQIDALTTYTNASVLAESVTNAYTTVDIYIWYEGQDPACASMNTLVTEALNVSVSFSVGDAI